MPSNASAPRLLDMPILTPSGFTRLAWAEWGAPDAPRTAICVHGLTRNARDFDALAQALAAGGWRVASVDVPGRGRSEWLGKPAHYSQPTYAAALAALIGRLGVETVDWVGTSMGGMIGMALAAQPKTPIRRLVLNDIGPFIPKAAIERIGSYVGTDERFASIEAVEAYLREINAPFGPLTDAQWRHLAVHSVVAFKGGYRLHYDPAIGEAFRATPSEDVSLWPLWEAIQVPVLVLRGARSDVLLAETTAEMGRRGAAAARGVVTVQEIAGVGHAPALMEPGQIRHVVEFLGAG